MVGKEVSTSEDVIAEQNFVRVTQDYTGQTENFLVYVDCPEGYVPISGGLYSNNLTSQLIESYPDYVNNRWYVRAYTFGSIAVTVHAVCMRSS
jgi:hypothetical protein